MRSLPSRENLMRKPAPHSEIPGALAKTGFPLEFQVASAFRNAGWAVINGHYYLDDVDGRARELDLIAYKVRKTAYVNVVTCFLISCKKDADNTWTFMSRDRPASDPNTDWRPIHAWTDTEPLRSFMSDLTWKDDFHNSAQPRHLVDATRDFFAYQLVSPDGKSPRNDKPIFESISGLLKALDHEITTRTERGKKRRRVFNFNLFTVVDAPLVEVSYKEDGALGCTDIDHLLYHARYLVRRQNLEALVHFTIPDRLESCVADAQILHEHNVAFFGKAAKDAYGAILTSGEVTKYFQELMQPKLLSAVRSRMKKLGLSGDVGSIGLVSLQGQRLELNLDVYDGQAEVLNADTTLRDRIAEILEKMARFKGDFIISDDVPF